MKKILLSACFTISLTVLLNAQTEKKAFTVDGKTASIYVTAESTDLKLSLTEKVAFKPALQPLESEICVFVNPKKTYQSLLGIGGAITDASAEVLAKAPKERQQEMIDAYYSKDKGIGYSILRTNIHSCDFSSDSYTYVVEGDKELKTFNIDHDRKFRIPLIKEALKAAGGKITTYASPWSPPAFMKTNGSMLKGGKLLLEYEASWALYYTKFVKAYEKEGIPIWGISVQNEPMATQTWESCIYTAEEERDFLKKYLGPTMAKEGLGDKKIIVWDHNRDLMSNRANVIFDDPEAAKYAWGMGFHWYETWTGGQPMFANVANVHESYPNVNLMFTEGCNERFTPEKYFFWPNAERYGAALINDFNNGSVAWTDWNIILDEKGGPNHVGNFCFAPVHYDIQADKIIYTPSYYYIGHFSKFIRPGAKRVSTSASRSVLQSTTFVNENGEMATVVMNSTDKEIQYNLYVGTSKVEMKIPAHGIQTLVY